MAKQKQKMQKKAAPAASKVPVQPISDRVLVKREEMDTTSPAGIIIPDTAKTEKSKRGVVLAIGPGRFGEEGDLIPMTVKVGQKVFFNSGWDNEVKLDGSDDEFFLIRESDILAILN